METGISNQKLEIAKKNKSQAKTISKRTLKGILLLLTGSGLLIITLLKDGKAMMANEFSFEMVLFFFVGLLSFTAGCILFIRTLTSLILFIKQMD